MDKLETAKNKLQSLVDYASKLETSPISTTFDSFHNWIFQCNSQVQQVFGSKSSQFDSIRNLQITSNYIASNQNSNGSAISLQRLTEITNKKKVLIDLIDKFNVEDIDSEYLEDLPVQQKIIIIQELLDEADAAIATGRILLPQYNLWHNKAFEALKKCFGFASPQTTAFSANSFSIVESSNGKTLIKKYSKGNEAEEKFKVQREFLSRQLTVLEKTYKRANQTSETINRSQNIEPLFLNTSASQTFTDIIDDEAIIQELKTISGQIASSKAETMHRFDALDTKQEELLSKVNTSYSNLLRAFTDEAKDGPRLFSFIPVDQKNFNPETWTKEKFIITLWCEHSRRPLPRVYGSDSTKGSYEIELTRDWLKQAAPYIKRITGVLKLVTPAVVPYIDLQLDDQAFEAIEEQLKFSEEVVTTSLSGAKELTDFASGESLTGQSDLEDAEQSVFVEKLERDATYGTSIHGEGGSLRALHALLKEKDPSFGGLVRVMNKRQEFLWVHPAYVDEY